MTAARAAADAVPVRIPESPTHAFLVLRSTDDKDLAFCEMLQTVRGARVESRLTFRFKDGSLSDETVVFSQAKVFTLESYRIVQRGPSFPKPTEVFFERKTGQYRAKDGDDTAQGRLEIPSDVHNGMTGLLVKNLPPGGTARGHLLAFTPKPVMLASEMKPEGEDRYFVGDQARKARRYVVTLDITGLKGVIADIIGKTPPELRYWISSGPAPAFLRFEGPMSMNGPRWRIELRAPRWPK